MTFPRVAATIAGLVLAVPFSVSAATAQQTLTQALDATKLDQAVHMDLRVQTQTRLYKTWNTPETQDVRLLFTYRQPKDHPKNAEGQVFVKEINTTGNAPVKDPFAIQWKSLDRAFYLRLERAAPEILDLFETVQVPPSLIGQWVRMDYSSSSDPFDMLRSSPVAGALPTDTLPSGLLSNNLLLKSLPLFQALSLRHATLNGKPVLRITARLSPTYLAKEQQAALRAITRTSHDAADVRQTNKTFADIRKFWTQPRFVFFIDPQTKKIPRVEFTYRGTSPEQTTTGYNQRTFQPIVKTTGRVVTTVTGGISLVSDAGGPVDAPATSMTFEELLNSINPTDTEATTTTIEP